jgi:hypothetical protein
MKESIRRDTVQRCPVAECGSTAPDYRAIPRIDDAEGWSPAAASMTIFERRRSVQPSPAGELGPFVVDGQQHPKRCATGELPMPGCCVRRPESRLQSRRSPAAGSIILRLAPDRAALGEKATTHRVSATPCASSAYTARRTLRATQTIRQLLPAMIESDMKVGGVPWTIPALTISDQHGSRGAAQCSTSRGHFFTVDEVKQYIDLLALYKLNVLHSASL